MSFARQARVFQQPWDALNTWGDPQRIEGSMSPIISFIVGRTESGPNVWVTLWYFPPARGPRRLEQVQITLSPSPTERDIIQWLGTPASYGKTPLLEERALIYGGRDRLGLVVIQVTFSRDHERAHFVLSGAPR